MLCECVISGLIRLCAGSNTSCRLRCIQLIFLLYIFFFFNDTATTEIYTLSLHDALPISSRPSSRRPCLMRPTASTPATPPLDRKSTRLNSSHGYISYAVFCLKKKKHQSYVPYYLVHDHFSDFSSHHRSLGARSA